jgi:hypothetical protein
VQGIGIIDGRGVSAAMGQRSTGRQQLGAFHAGKPLENTAGASPHATRRAQNSFLIAGCSRLTAKNSLLDRNLQFESVCELE